MKPDNHICHPNSVSIFIAILLCIQILFVKTTYCQELTTRVSCIGNSITWGHGLPDRENNYYPAKLDKLLGAGWEVNNYAYWGRTVLRNGDFPYWNIPEFTAAIASNPDIVTIMLGTNDSKTWNWINFGSEFKSDYELLIDTFQKLESKPLVWICYPIPAFENEFGISNDNIIDSIIPILSQISLEMGLPVIDLYYYFTEMENYYLEDGVHPNLDGSTALASKFYDMLKQEQPQIEQVDNQLITAESAGYQWYLNGEPITDYNGNNNNLIISDTGVYKALLYISASNNDRIITREIRIDTVHAAIRGNFKQCRNTMDAIYETQAWHGKTIQWEILEGTITSGQGTPQITVNWNNQGPGQIKLMITEEGKEDTSRYTAFIYLMDNSKPSVEQNDLKLTASDALLYQWYANGETVTVNEGGDQQEIYAHTGEYHVVVTYENGCQASSDTLQIQAEGISKEKIPDPVAFYPNPVTDILHIELDHPYIGIIHIKFYDILGNEININSISTPGSQIVFEVYQESHTRILFCKVLQGS
jgi:lysophospholipase L1-like esterase